MIGMCWQASLLAVGRSKRLLELIDGIGDMRRLWRLTVVCALLMAGLVVAQETPMAAQDVTITQCSYDALVQALAEVYGAGGGTISFDCGQDPVTILLESEQVVVPTDNPVVIDGGGLVTLSGGDQTRLFHVEDSAWLELRDITLRDGDGTGGLLTGSGGAILNSGTLTITGSTLTENSAELGGAVYNVGGSLTISGATLAGNSAGSGGAIYSEGGAVTITDSTLSGNAADIGGGAIYSVAGAVAITSSTLNDNAAIDGGALFTGAGLTITTSTLSGNESTDVGGAIFSAGTTAITSSTLIGNAAIEGAAIFSLGFEAVSLHSSIIAGGASSASTCAGPSGFVSQGYNLSDDGSCNLTATGDLPNTDPQLQELGKYGGTTQTHRPEPGSRAVDRIPASACATDESGMTPPDQRGVSKPQSIRCDIGSVEVLAGRFCANRATGVIRDADTGDCGRLELEISLEYDGPLTFCVNRVTGELRMASSGRCGQSQLTLVLPDDGPVTVCVHRVTGQMRLAGASGCTLYEIMREIGGGIPAG